MQRAFSQANQQQSETQDSQDVNLYNNLMHRHPTRIDIIYSLFQKFGKIQHEIECN